MVLRRHRKEFDPGPSGFDPLHSRQINLNRPSPVIRVHYERNVLTGTQTFRKPQSASPSRNIRDLSTSKSEFVRDDRTKSNHLPSVAARF
jgi:hypothetical protein